jgi:hypothetical protein
MSCSIAIACQKCYAMKLTQRIYLGHSCCRHELKLARRRHPYRERNIHLANIGEERFVKSIEEIPKSEVVALLEVPVRHDEL